MKANPAQERVINEIYGQSIVVACPGSGKTTTLLRRINHMIKDEGIPAEEILMITFTKAAADEMKRRFLDKYDKNAAVTFCTIHALCMAVLKKFLAFDLSNILNNPYPAVMNIIKADPRHLNINNLDDFTKDVLSDISMIKNSLFKEKEYTPKCCTDRDFFFDIYHAYEREKEERGVIDYDDMLVKAYNLIMSERDCLDYLRDKYAFIHVDEYQDTNFIQRDIVYAISGNNGNIVVVGDDDQSIYAFRGARPEVMKDFLVHYPDANEIYMSTNYRSDKEVIKASSKLIECNTVRFQKDINGASSDSGSVFIKKYASEHEEKMNMCMEISRMVSGGIDPNGIAVLYRTNAQAETIAELLMRNKVPFYSNEPIPDRYSDDMFLDIMAYYHMSQKHVYPNGQNDFIRTITKPNRYFMNKYQMRYQDSCDEMKKKAKEATCEGWKIEKAVDAIDKYHKFLFCLKFMKPDKFMDMLYLQGGYRQYLKEYSVYRNVPFEDMESKWESYKNDLKRNNINSFDEWEKYANRYSIAIQQKQNEREGVCISTMHKSKGLEWDNVFIADCMEGSTPYYKAESKSEIEEERRLFYVAMTRAKHNLYLYYYKPMQNRKGTSTNLKHPSRFLSESGLDVR